jgi:hypothetical protein
LLVVGCLFPDLDPLDHGSDASSSDVVSDIVEAGTDVIADVPPEAAVMCDPTSLFTAIVPVPGIAPGDSENPRLSQDELEIFFQVYVSSTTEIVHATRASVTSSFGAASQLTAIDTAGDNWDQMLSADGVTLVFASDRVNGNDALYRATRPSPSADFGAPSVIPSLDDPSVERDKPYVQGDNVALWYMSTESGSGDIYVAPNSGGDYGNPQMVTELDTSIPEGFPVVNGDATVIYFYRGYEYDEADGATAEDIWMATRPSASVPFSVPVPVSELNTKANDDPGWLSPDMCRLYFTSDHTGTAMLYMASRQP